MHRPRLVVFPLMLATLVIVPAAAQAQVPTCAQLGTDPSHGLAGNATVIALSTTLVTTGVAVPYCRVDFTVSERGGPAFGYAVGEIQRVGLRIGLPANTADGGSGGGPGGQGAWNGKVRNLGGGGLVGNVGSVTNATNARYVGSSTDSGHPAADNPGFGVIQATHELDLGRIEDFFSESLRLQYQWALRLANAYYGTPATRNYWDGCSTGGRQGLVLRDEYGNDFDGFLIGAPHTNHSRTSGAGTWKAWVNQEIAGGTVDNTKTTATVNRMIAACDGQDGVIDGLLSDPRTCHASATLNLCGQPGAADAPACLNPAEAQAIDMAMDGARNDLGAKVWVSYGRGSAASMAVSSAPTGGTGGNGVYGWANKDMTYDWRLHPLSDWDDVDQLGTTTVGPYIDMGSTNLDLVKNSGGKILMWHGLADQLIPFEQNIYYYNEVVDNYGGAGNVTPWMRFFLAPGVTHCGGGVGPQPQNLFDEMVNWSEHGVAPDSILASGGGRTRPLCPFPQTAVYDGVGDPNVASSFSCGGNLQTKEVKCSGLLVKYQHETGTAYQPLNGEDDVSCGFASVPVTTATLSPGAVHGWYHDPVVTLHATDADADVQRTEYSLDGAGWTIYIAPFQITGEGSHTVEYRSLDKADHVEHAHTLAVKIDTTAPVLSGLPAADCSIWPANNKLVEIARVKAVDARSGVAVGSPSVHVTASERVSRSDIVVTHGKVLVRATSTDRHDERVYTVTARALDFAGNLATSTASCTVARNRSDNGNHGHGDDHGHEGGHDGGHDGDHDGGHGGGHGHDHDDGQDR